jgi:hypothetical protein
LGEGFTQQPKGMKEGFPYPTKLFLKFKLHRLPKALDLGPLLKDFKDIAQRPSQVRHVWKGETREPFKSQVVKQITCAPTHTISFNCHILPKKAAILTHIMQEKIEAQRM